MRASTRAAQWRIAHKHASGAAAQQHIKAHTRPSPHTLAPQESLFFIHRGIAHAWANYSDTANRKILSRLSNNDVIRRLPTHGSPYILHAVPPLLRVAHDAMPMCAHGCNMWSRMRVYCVYVRVCLQFFGEGMATRMSESDKVVLATATVVCASYCEMLVLHQKQFWEVMQTGTAERRGSCIKAVVQRGAEIREEREHDRRVEEDRESCRKSTSPSLGRSSAGEADAYARSILGRNSRVTGSFWRKAQQAVARKELHTPDSSTGTVLDQVARERGELFS